MIRYFLYSILITAFFGVSATIASDKELPGDENALNLQPKKSCFVTNASGQNPFPFNDLYPDMQVVVSSHLHLRDYACLLLTNKELAGTLKNRRLNIYRKPIPFGTELLADISDRLAVLPFPSWHNEICCRLVVSSFNPIFGAGVTWNTCPDVLEIQRKSICDELKSDLSSSHHNKLESLDILFRGCEKSGQSLLQDISSYSETIDWMMPRCAGVYLTGLLNKYFRTFASEDLPAPTQKPKDRIDESQTMLNRLYMLQWVKDSIGGKSPVPLSPVVAVREKSLHRVDLLQAFWKTKFYHDEFTIKLQDKLQNRRDLASLLEKNYTKMLCTDWLSSTCIPCESVAQTMNGWLSEIYMSGKTDPASLSEKSKFCTFMHDQVRTLHYELAHQKATDATNLNIKAFYATEAAVLAPNPLKKTQAWTIATNAKLTEAKLLDTTTDDQKKMEAFEVAIFFNEQIKSCLPELEKWEAEEKAEREKANSKSRSCALF